MKFLLLQLNRFFDAIDSRWDTIRVQRSIANMLIAAFVGGLIVIELGRQRLLPPQLRAAIPTNHFYAVDLALILLLLVEVIGLVFALARSVSDSVGKQFEVLSLILLRQTFKELTYFQEPIEWHQISDAVPYMLSDASGAILIFVLLGLYYRVQRHLPIAADTEETAGFVATKKLIALFLLIAFAFAGLDVLWCHLAGTQSYSFFEALYTVLIFSDVLIVLISLRYSTSYWIVFRYFGFAVATVLIRVALTAPRFIDALLGVGAALFALGLSLAYNMVAPVLVERKE
jgi:hypothetical protein